MVPGIAAAIALWAIFRRLCDYCGPNDSEPTRPPPRSPRRPRPVIPAPAPGMGAPPFPTVPDLEQPSSPSTDKSVPGLEHWGGGTSTVPWPSVLPTDLPVFPGKGWEFDEPPPPEVQKRAGALLSQLWKTGKGTHKTEKTGGRWITYQAQVVASGKRGVVAYRLRSDDPRIARRPGIVRARPRPVSAPSPPAPRRSAPAAAQRPSAASKLQLPMLRYGRGLKPAAPDPDVRIAQGKLGIEPDGRFGSGTRRAVVAFQRSRGLAPDGIVGPDTWVALLATGKA